MRKTKEILRLKWSLAMSHRDVARSLNISAGSVGSVLARAATAGLNWPAVEGLSEDALEQLLYGAAKARTTSKPLPDFVWVHAERSKPGVTLELLHQEYLESHPDGYRYTQYCDYYREWLASRHLTMRIEHRAGEKLFVDYSGKKPHYIDRATGLRVETELFVAVLGASNYTFAEATHTQRGPDWIASHVRAFAFLGGTTAMTVPDQLKSGVTHACLYEPAIQRTYEEMATHYGISVFPARPKKPKDKSKVEVGVQVVQRWILARMRNQTFFSLDELNTRIAELLVDLNNRRMRKYGASRRELFERVDRPALRGLPETPFTYADWTKTRVNLDYHVELDGHYYSVPFTYAREEVEIRFTGATVEVYRRGDRIAAHARAPANRGPLDRHTTLPEHMPASHRKHMEWTPTRILEWARTVGTSTTVLVTAILSERPHPEQGYRSCLGILRLGGTYGDDRLELACRRAFRAGARSYRHVDTILKNGLDRLEDDAPTDTKIVQHSNVRGGSYYH